MKKRVRQEQGGYALVGIMAVMMFGLILTMAAAPKVRYEAQREKEEEMLWRGQQIARGLAGYNQARGSYPKELKDLTKSVDMGARKLRFLRPSALCDPMTPCNPGETNWRLVYPGDPIVKRFYDAYMEYLQRATLSLQGTPQAGGMAGSAMAPPELLKYARLGAAKLPGGLGSSFANSGGLDSTLGGGAAGGQVNTQARPGQPALNQDAQGIQPITVDESESAGNDTFGSSFGRPIIGVVSRKAGEGMFRNYYGIEKYDESLFFSGVNVIAAGFRNPYVLAAPIGPSSRGPRDPNCPNGAVTIDGKCWGGVAPVSRPPDAPPENKQ